MFPRKLFLFNLIEFHPCTCKLVFSQRVKGTTMEISFQSSHLFIYLPCKSQLPRPSWTSDVYLLNSTRTSGFVLFPPPCAMVWKLPLERNLRLGLIFFVFLLLEIRVLYCLLAKAWKQYSLYFVLFSSCLWWRVSLDPVTHSWLKVDMLIAKSFKLVLEFVVAHFKYNHSGSTI